MTAKPSREPRSQVDIALDVALHVARSGQRGGKAGVVTTSQLRCQSSSGTSPAAAPKVVKALHQRVVLSRIHLFKDAPDLWRGGSL